MDVARFRSDSVTVKIDNKEVKNYLYTAREADALLKGGVQQIYLAISRWKHELVAFSRARDRRARLQARRHDQLRQGIGASIGIKITTGGQASAKFSIKDWE